MLTCSASAACDRVRAASDSRSCSSTRARVSRSGPTRCSTAARRISSSLDAVGVRRLQPPLGDLEEPRGARVQRLRGQRLEPLRELALDERGPLGRAALDHPGSLLGGAGPLVGSAGPARQVRGGGGEPTAGEQVSDRCPDDDPEQQSGKQQDCTHMQR